MHVSIPKKKTPYILLKDWTYELPPFPKNEKLGKELGYTLDTSKRPYAWLDSDGKNTQYAKGILSAGTVVLFLNTKSKIDSYKPYFYVKIGTWKNPENPQVLFPKLRVTLDSFNTIELEEKKF